MDCFKIHKPQLKLARLVAIVAVFTLLFSDVFGQRIWVEKRFSEQRDYSTNTYWQNTNDKNESVFQAIIIHFPTKSDSSYLKEHYGYLDHNEIVNVTWLESDICNAIILKSFDGEYLSSLVQVLRVYDYGFITNFSVLNVPDYKEMKEPFFFLNEEGSIPTKFLKESSTVRRKNVSIKLPQLHLTFKTDTLKTLKERMALMVLEEMLQLPSSTFRQKLLESGLCIDAKFNSGGFSGKPSFYLEPNPMGAKNAIDSFFSELYKMHQFDYSTVEQLDLAKQRLRNKWAYAEDLFTTSAIELADYQHYSTLEAYKNRANTLDSITKVDLFNAIKNHLHNKAFHIEWQYPRNNDFEHKELFRNSVAVNSVVLDFEKRDMTLDHKNEEQLEELSYTLNLSPKGTLTLISADAKKKRALKRAEKLKEQLEREHRHLDIKVVYARLKENANQITFKYEPVKN